MEMRRGGPRATLRAGQAHCGGTKHGACPCLLCQPRAAPMHPMRSHGRNRLLPRFAANWHSSRMSAFA
eukprot:1911597-Pyramimonas_sp.AAC.1